MASVTLTATGPLDVTIGGRRYQADAGGTIRAVPAHAARLARFGVTASGDVDVEVQGDGLDELTAAQLAELARDREIRGRSTMTREELLEALRTNDAQEG
jgi:hypothetical protein